MEATSNYPLVRRTIIVVAIILITVSSVYLLLPLSFGAGEFLKYVILLSCFTCIAMAVITFFLAIMRKALWKEFWWYLFAVFMITAFFFYIFVSSFHRC